MPVSNAARGAPRIPPPVDENAEHDVLRNATYHQGKNNGDAEHLAGVHEHGVDARCHALFPGGTEDMMALVLGEAKRPDPPPMSAW